MESKITLKATDRQAQHFFDNYHVKMMEFSGDKELYPEMDMNSKVVHPWRVVLRHSDEVGRLTGTFTYNELLGRLS